MVNFHIFVHINLYKFGRTRIIIRYVDEIVVYIKNEDAKCIFMKISRNSMESFKKRENPLIYYIQYSASKVGLLPLCALRSQSLKWISLISAAFHQRALIAKCKLGPFKLRNPTILYM